MSFYIVDVYSGDVLFTTNEAKALEFSEAEEQYVVIDTDSGKVRFCDGEDVLVEILED